MLRVTSPQDAREEKAAALEAVENIGERFDGDPVELNVLTHGKDRRRRNRISPRGRQSFEAGSRESKPFGMRMRTMKIWHGFAFTAVASNHTGTVSLRIDSPPAEVRAQPFRRDRGVAFTGEAADFRETLPGIHRLL